MNEDKWWRKFVVQDEDLAGAISFELDGLIMKLLLYFSITLSAHNTSSRNIKPITKLKTNNRNHQTDNYILYRKNPQDHKQII